MSIDPISLGIEVALTAASMALTASQHYEGPRVQDLKATSADYGTPLTNFYGRRVYNCPVFWAEDLKDNTRETKSKGGKMESHYASGSCAVHVADHAIDRILRIWADEHLIYDRDGAQTVFQFTTDGSYNLLDHLRFYTGTADQNADPRMLADIETKFGAGTCPAYRYQSYFVIEDVPLDLIGNRYPQWRVEAESMGLTTFPMDAKVSLPFPLPRNTNPAPADRQPQVILNVEGRLTNGASAYSIFWELDVDTTNTALQTQTFTVGSATFTVQYQFHATATENFVTVHITDNDPTFNYLNFAYYPHVFGDNVAPWNTKVFQSTITNINTGNARLAYFDPASEWEYFSGDDQWEYQANVWANSPAGTQTDFYRYPKPAILLGDIFNDLSTQAGLDGSEYDYSAFNQIVKGFSWTQGTPKQIAAYLLDVYDCDIVPHDFSLVGKMRGETSLGAIATSEMVAGADRYTLPYSNDRDLPRTIYFNFADLDADQNPNSAQPAPRLVDATVSSRVVTVDATTLAMSATDAKQSVDRYHRRTWFSRVAPQFALTRQRLALEPGDVYTPNFDGVDEISRLTKLTIGAAGVLKTEWAQDNPTLATSAGAVGAGADGFIPSTVYDPSTTEGAVLDLPLLTDAQDQAAPFAYVVAGPDQNKPWPGANFSESDTGAPDSFTFGWDAVASGNATIFGTASTALNNVDPWVWDYGSSLTVTIDSGTLASSTPDAMLNDGTVNLALVGNELVQFQTATLTAPLTYTLTGFLRGCRGTEQYVGTHTTSDPFTLLSAAKIHTLGASLIGDTDSYVASTSGQVPDETTAFTLTFAANAHKPYSPVYGSITLSGSDKHINATRRTRIGGSALNGQDVPLGEASQSWSADIFDGSTFKRTINGTSLPLVYTAAEIAADGVVTLVVKLYQVDPTLNLRGFPLTING